MSSTMPNEQPDLGVEQVLTDLEIYFADNQPRNLWPENKNSNFGFLRELLLMPKEEAIELLSELSNETFVTTTSGYLARWEQEYGLPRGQGGRTTTLRRNTVISRKARGRFTRTRRRLAVEASIQETFGAPLLFTAEGLIFTGSGLEFHSDTADITDLYSIVEDVEGFTYDVRIDNTVTVDEQWLRRELDWMTPAHINYTITYIDTGGGGGIGGAGEFGGGDFGGGDFGG